MCSHHIHILHIYLQKPISQQKCLRLASPGVYVKIRCVLTTLQPNLHLQIITKTEGGTPHVEKGERRACEKHSSTTYVVRSLRASQN